MQTHFIMNHHELLTIIQSYQTIFTFLVDRGLLAARRQCHCGTDMVLRERSESEDGFHWEYSYPTRYCRKRLTSTSTTWATSTSWSTNRRTLSILTQEPTRTLTRESRVRWRESWRQWWEPPKANFRRILISSIGENSTRVNTSGTC